AVWPRRVDAVSLIQSDHSTTGVDAVSLIQSDLKTPDYGPGNLELVARLGDRLAFFWRPDAEPNNAPAQWRMEARNVDGNPVAGGAGPPALLQRKDGNFELVVPLARGGLAHYWRNNHQNGYPWKEIKDPFPGFTKRVDAVSLIQCNVGNCHGTLKLV